MPHTGHLSVSLGDILCLHSIMAPEREPEASNVSCFFRVLTCAMCKLAGPLQNKKIGQITITSNNSASYVLNPLFIVIIY